MAQELRCSECEYLIDSCGECNCYQAFGLSDLDQSQRHYYRAQFLELITYIKRNGVPNLSADNRDYYELQRVAWIAIRGDGIISAIDYNAHGVNIYLGPQYFDFMETQNKESSISSEPAQLGESSNSAERHVRESSNSGDNGGRHKTASVSYPNIDKAGFDNSAQEVNNTSLRIEKGCRSAGPVELHENKDNLNSRSVLLLRLRLTRIFEYQYLVLDIVGECLDWQQILHDVESNTLELRWTFYKTVINFGESDEDSDEEVEEDEYEHEDRGPPPASVSAIENLGTEVISHEQVVSGDALCSICKDMIPVGEEAKKLPCGHLYHRECITRWLNVRNFCPLCRYKMPTDDP